MGADLQALTKEAASICINRIFGLLMEQDETEELEARQNVSNFLRTRKNPLAPEELESLAIETCDFFDALKKCTTKCEERRVRASQINFKIMSLFVHIVPGIEKLTLLPLRQYNIGFTKRSILYSIEMLSRKKTFFFCS